MSQITRRFALCGAASVLVAGSVRAAPLRELTLWGPPAGPSIILAHAIESGTLRHIADNIRFRAWRNPDELRAGLTSRTMDLFILPTQVAANLYNRGLGVRLVNVMTNGLLYVVTGDGILTNLPALKGRNIAVPFRNDMPDLLFRRLLAAHGMSLDSDVNARFTGSPIEAMQLLLTDRIEAALLPEPAATAAIVRAGVAGKNLTRTIDIQQVWAGVTGHGPALPQAGLGVSAPFYEKHPETVAALRDALVAATASVNANPAQAANDAASMLEMPWPVLEKSVPYSNLVALRAADARASLEEMYRTLAEFDAGIIGGALPAVDFYL